LDEKVDWSPNLLPDVNTSPGEEFYYPTAKDQTLDFSVKNLAEDKDACFTIKYFVSKNSKLSMKYNDQKLLDFKLTQNTLKSSDWSEDQQFCVRDLVGEVNKEFTFSFEADMPDYDQDKDLVAIYFVTQMKEKPLGDKLIDFKNIPFIPKWYEVGLENQIQPLKLTVNSDNLWPIRVPNTLWKTQKDKNIVIFNGIFKMK
jgi:hypothetical protein